MTSDKPTAGEQPYTDRLDEVDTVRRFREHRKRTVTLLADTQIGTGKVGRGLLLARKSFVDEFRTLGSDDSTVPSDLIRVRYSDEKY